RKGMSVPRVTRMIAVSRPLLVLATLLTVMSRSVAGQDAGVLHIKVHVIEADGKPMPVPRHALLISDNPPTAVPRRVVTTLDGTAHVGLGRGSYMSKPATPLTFNGKAYQWTQIVEMTAGHDAVLELTADNAEVTSAASGSISQNPLETDDSLLAE